MTRAALALLMLLVLRPADARPADGRQTTGETAMTVNAVIALFVFFVCIAALAVLLSNGIADEPPATPAERRFWPGDVVEDNGEYNGEYDD